MTPESPLGPSSGTTPTTKTPTFTPSSSFASSTNSNPEWKLSDCRYCRGINLESLSAPGGYRHASNRASLVRSAQKCKLCSLLFRRDRTRHSSPIWLSLGSLDDEDIVCLKVGHGEAQGHRTEDSAFFLFTLAGDPSVDYGITVKHQLSDTSSPDSFRRVDQWIDDCRKNHICSKRVPLKDHENSFQLWPARLVDVDAFLEGDPDVRLIDNDGSARKYITLSYCWGQSKTFTTTSRSLRLRKSRIKFDTIPKTFQDAIVIARHLRVRYLWIDALCIVQDDRKDWEKESTKMGAIYSMAYVTIAADSGVDCNSGCFNIQSTTQDQASDNVPFELVSTTSDERESKLFLWDPSRGVQKPTPSELDASPLAERGWVCQERILSPRILHYTSSQLFWECRQVLLAEDNLRPWTISGGSSATVCGLARNLYGTTTDPSSRRHLLDIWYNSVVSQSYSSRKLTKPDDKLTAISGIARAFGRHFQSRYVAGIWLLDLHWGLSWRRRGPIRRPLSYRAPSFSWASMDATVEWPVPSNTQKSCINVEAVEVGLSGGDYFGRVQGAFLVLKGHIHSASAAVRKTINPGGFDRVWQLRNRAGTRWLGTAYMDAESADEDDTMESVEFLILSHDEETKHSEVLLVGKIGGSETTYERKGVAQVLGFDVGENLLDDKSMAIITLV